MVEAASAEHRLGPVFGRLLASSVAANVADGLARTAAPLLATTLTDDPLAFSLVGAMVFLPWLLFGIPAGRLVDRMDRRMALALGNGVRVAALAVISAAIATDALSLPLLIAVTFLIGAGETVTDNATNALVPATVAPTKLDRANGRIMFAQISLDSFVATPIAGLLFAVAIVVPFASAAAGYALSACFVLLLPRAVGRAYEVPGPLTADEQVRGAGSSTTTQDAIRFLVHHRYLGWMTVAVSLLGGWLAFGQAASALLFLDEFGVPIASIGLVTAGIGVGAVAGSLVAATLVARFGRGLVMWVAALLAGLGLGGVGLAPNVWIAVVSWAIGAAAVSVWNVPWGAIRQELTPAPMLGTVIGAIRTVGWGMFPVATLLGGLAARVDLRLPYLIAGVGTVTVVLVASRLILSATRVTAQHRATA